MSKYIDLYEKITHPRTTTNDYRRGVIDTLGFLDRNPDQVPGRTITESEFAEAVDASKVSVDGVSAPDFLRQLGITVVPDPEPTNAELIDEAYEVWDLDPQDFTFGEYLVRLGWTKAPGGDDE